LTCCAAFSRCEPGASGHHRRGAPRPGR
jgi:hypothetical protein